MTHEIVRTMHDWMTLGREWNALLARSRGDSLFMTWQWLNTWIRVHDMGSSLFVVCVRDAHGRLAGIAPFYKTSYSLLGLFGYRVLRILGDRQSGAEYQTWISSKVEENDVLGEITKALGEHASEWDLIWMPSLDAWSGISESVAEALRAHGFAINQRPTMFSSISLPGDFEAYLKLMSSNRRQQVRRMTKKILSKPGVEVRKVTSLDDIGPSLEALFALHNKRWQAVGQSGVFQRRPKEREFYEHFVPQAFERGWLSMYTLLDGGVPKAVQIGYVYGHTLLQLQEGFDPDYTPHVGNALRAYVIGQCIKAGVREYDFLGGSSEHKRRWLARDRIGMDLLAAAPHLKNLPIMSGGVWPTGAYLRPVESS